MVEVQPIIKKVNTKLWWWLTYTRVFCGIFVKIYRSTKPELLMPYLHTSVCLALALEGEGLVLQCQSHSVLQHPHLKWWNNISRWAAQPETALHEFESHNEDQHLNCPRLNLQITKLNTKHKELAGSHVIAKDYFLIFIQVRDGKYGKTITLVTTESKIRSIHRNCVTQPLALQ